MVFMERLNPFLKKPGISPPPSWKEERRDDQPGHLVLPLQLHLDVDGLAAGEVILVQNLVRQFNIRIPAHKTILSINQS